MSRRTSYRRAAARHDRALARAVRKARQRQASWIDEMARRSQPGGGLA
jgi:hypothetical protein